MSDGKVEFDVRANTSKITSDLNAVNQLVQRSAQETQKKVDNIGKTAVEAIKPMTDAAEKAAESIDDLGKEAGETAKDVKQLGEETENTADKTEDLGKEAEEATKKIKEQGEQSKKSAESTEKLKMSVDKVKDSVKDAKEQLGKYAVAAGAAFAAVGAAAIKSATDAETSFAKVKTLLSDGIMVDDYYNSIKKASANTGVGFGSMAESVYSAISASVDESKAVEFTENAVKLAKGGFTETATAVDVLTTAINAYGLAADDATHISDVLITTQNAGKTTVDELARSMGQTIPIANSANVAIEELSTAYAVMTKNGVATAEAGTQIKAMLNELNSTGSNVDKTLREVTGKSFAELKSEGQTTADVLNTLAEYADASGKKLSDMFSSVEAGSAALNIVKDGGTDFANILNQMQNSAGATEKAYETMSNTIEERLNKLKNRFVLALTDVGEKLMPKIEKFADYIDDHFDEISDTIEGIGEATEQAAEFLLGLTKVLWDNKEAVGAAVAGYIAFKTAMSIGNVIQTVVSATKNLTTATKTATTAQEAMNVACNANPYVLLASAIIGVVGAIGTFAAFAVSASANIKETNAEVDALISSSKSYKEEAGDLEKISDKYSEIYNSEKSASEKAEELMNVQEELVSSFGDEAEGIDLVNGNYSDQIKLLDDIIKKKKDMSETDIKSAYLTAVQEQDKQWEIDFGNIDSNVREAAKKMISEVAEEFDVATTNGTFFDAGKIFFGAGTSYEQRAEVLRSVIEKINRKFDDDQIDAGLYKLLNEQLSEMEKAVENLDTVTELYNGTKEEGTKNTEAAVSANTALSKSLSQLISTTDDARKQLEELDNSANKLITDYSSLYDALKNLEKGGALNYDQMQKLIKLYPELADKVEMTADGYTLEIDALGDLRLALDDSVNATVEAEKAKTQAVIEGARDRMIAYNSEIALLYQHGDVEKAHQYEELLRNAKSEIDEAEAKMKTLDTIPEYLKSEKGKSTSSGSGTSGGGSSGGSSKAETSGKGGDAEKEKKYDKAYDTLKYKFDMGEIDAKTFYDSVDNLRDEFLEEDSTKWRSVNVARHKWEESLKKDTSGSKSTKSSSGSGKTVISIDSYIPGVWDTEEERAAKLKKGAELGVRDYKSSIRSIKTDAATVGSTVASTAPVSSTTAETTLTDVVSAIKDMQTANEHKKISLDVELKARNLTIGKVCIEDVNDIARSSGKSPFVFK